MAGVDRPNTLGALLGRWQGPGEGHYPTIEPFRYVERVSIEPVAGKPVLSYRQRTWRPDTRTPMHSEIGYLRPAGDDRVELLLVQPTGFAEVHVGRFDGHVLDLELASLARTPTAKHVRSVRRRFVVDDDVLAYDLWMAYADVPQTHHLHAELRRTGRRDRR
ncbi:MAG: FABP family protein [Actinomycetota bacterium]|nr:FABP family protein [Actinomycetota bacterium]